MRFVYAGALDRCMWTSIDVRKCTPYFCQFYLQSGSPVAVEETLSFRLMRVSATVALD